MTHIVREQTFVVPPDESFRLTMTFHTERNENYRGYVVKSLCDGCPVFWEIFFDRVLADDCYDKHIRIYATLIAKEALGITNPRQWAGSTHRRPK